MTSLPLGINFKLSGLGVVAVWMNSDRFCWWWCSWWREGLDNMDEDGVRGDESSSDVEWCRRVDSVDGAEDGLATAARDSVEIDARWRGMLGSDVLERRARELAAAFIVKNRFC